MKNEISSLDPLQLLRKTVGRLTGKKAVEQKNSFNIRQSLEGVHTPLKKGISLIALEKIIGSVGRAHEFQNLSKPGGNLHDERLLSIISAMRRGKKMPPVSLYQIKEDYYIVDGHHRFKAAQELGLTAIEANIVELVN